MKKYLLASVLLVTFNSQMSFAAEQICGTVKKDGSALTMDMNSGGTAFLSAEDGWIFKHRSELLRLVGSDACVTGEWYDDYTFDVMRVN